MDNKVEEIEEKIRCSWVNLKEMEMLKSPLESPGKEQPSKLKLLLTKQKSPPTHSGLSAMGDTNGGGSPNENDLHFVDGETQEMDYGLYNSEFLNGEGGIDDIQSEGAESGNTIEYSDSPGSIAFPTNETPININGGELTPVNGIKQEPITQNNGTEAVPVTQHFTGTYYKCVKCSYTTEHKTSMLRHIMWKIGYKPYRCPHCGFQDVLVNGLRKHCLRKHKGS